MIESSKLYGLHFAILERQIRDLPKEEAEQIFERAEEIRQTYFHDGERALPAIHLALKKLKEGCL